MTSISLISRGRRPFSSRHPGYYKQQGVLAEYAYPVLTLGPATGPVRSLQGITFLVDRSYLDFDEKLDTLLVAGSQAMNRAR